MFSKPVPNSERWYLGNVVAEMDAVKITARITAGRISYDPAAAFEYAQQWCHSDENECGAQYDADCTHFMCHCLAAGGIRVSGPDAGSNCPAGLNIAVRFLVEAFEKMRVNCSNVLRIGFDEHTLRGDYGFLQNWLRPYHAFLLNDSVNANGRSAKIFGHTNPRCGAEVADDGFVNGTYYRIQ